MITLPEIRTETNGKQVSLFTKLTGIFKFSQIIPVLSVTTIIAIQAFFSSGGFQPKRSFILVVLTALFQQIFVGLQNDYVDRDFDKLYGKSKAIAKGWVKAKTALILSIICYLIFTGLSIGLGKDAIIGYWIVLYIQGANAIAMIYNLYAKNSPVSLVPLLIAFPLAPIFAWLVYGGFEWQHLWYLPMFAIIAISGHISNELPDIENDEKYGNRNFIVIIGKKVSTIVFLIGVGIAGTLVLALYFVYGLNMFLFIGIFCTSLIIGIIGFVTLWIKKWNANEVIFNSFTMYLGIMLINLIFILNT